MVNIVYPISYKGKYKVASTEVGRVGYQRMREIVKTFVGHSSRRFVVVRGFSNE